MQISIRCAAQQSSGRAALLMLGPIVRGSAIDGHGRSAGDAWNPMQSNQLESGVRGRNRPVDTRIFSNSERLARRGEAEEAERVFDAPTEPPSPTEPLPNHGGSCRSNRAVSSRNARASVHRDRAQTEPQRSSSVLRFTCTKPIPSVINCQFESSSHGQRTPDGLRRAPPSPTIAESRRDRQLAVLRPEPPDRVPVGRANGRRLQAGP